MLIADAQVHIWQANSAQRPWKEGIKPHWDHPLSAEDVLGYMDKAGVRRAILTPTGLDFYRNDLSLAAAQRYPDRFGVMGRFELDAPGARDLVATWRKQPGMLGLRYSIVHEQDVASLNQGRIDWLWPAAEKAGVPVMLLVPPSELHVIDRIAERHPKLKLVLDHFGLPSGKLDEEAFRDFDKVLATAKWPNVAVKASALPCYTSDSYPYLRLHPYIRRAYDAFGPRRMFWGTDFSRLPHSCSYGQALTMFTEEISWLSQQDKEWIIGRGLCEWLDWKLPD